MTTLREELKQTRPFTSLEEEAALAVLRTAAVLDHATAEMLKPFGVTPTQYNVLRILRGAGERGLCRYEIGDRLVSKVPDVTRLLDRLVDVGLVERERSDGDRRLVTTRITAAGLALLGRIDAPLAAFHAERLGHLGEPRLRALVDLLAEARASG
jgi:DNA-binding MarR family transcriptional regulator